MWGYGDRVKWLEPTICPGADPKGSGSCVVRSGPPIVKALRADRVAALARLIGVGDD